MTTQTYLVDGMTCAHCAASVSKEVGTIRGVSDVTVDVSARTLVVTSDEPLGDSDVVSAVDSAGYTFAGRA
ncbi:MAG: heavy-metal-associated domain-containing protein [Actinobacteria bacterium]|nr:heavy-metal-associated domain-containing protein [Actinomycetota bacterium]